MRQRQDDPVPVSGHTVLGDKDICGFQVAVNLTLAVEVGQRKDKLSKHRSNLWVREQPVKQNKNALLKAFRFLLFEGKLQC